MARPVVKTARPAAAVMAVLAVLALPACTPVRAPAATAPVADAPARAEELIAATMPDSPRRVTFSWAMDEAGSRVRGRGVVRFVAPDRLRLDLFGPRGETYLAAALVDGEFRLPPDARGAVPLPSPALLWGALGVLRPPPGGELQEARTGEGITVLEYTTGGGERFRFHLTTQGQTVTIRTVERMGEAGVLETLRLRYAGDELRTAVYQDPVAFRELTLNLESAQDVPSFPESVWSPGDVGG